MYGTLVVVGCEQVLIFVSAAGRVSLRFLGVWNYIFMRQVRVAQMLSFGLFSSLVRSIRYSDKAVGCISQTKSYFPPSRVFFWKKIRTCASFTKIQANYTSKESMYTVIMECDLFLFSGFR